MSDATAIPGDVPPNRSMVDVERHVHAYEQGRPRYEVFEHKLADLLSELLDRTTVKLHVIEHRTKTPESFREKITRPGKSYSDPMEDLHDLVGLRAIVYYTDDVPKIEALIEKEFQVYRDESSDRSALYKPNEFGYLSVHYIVSLAPSRAVLAEWNPYSEMKVEIQVRTVLQHAWAVISHALQYKREADVPDELKRKLFRVAGVFELVDEQFVEIKRQHLLIERRVALELDSFKKDIPMDTVSLTEFIKRSEHLSEIARFASTIGFQVQAEESRLRDSTSDVVEECARLKLHTVDQITERLVALGDGYREFLKAAMGYSHPWVVDRPFLLHLVIIRIFKDDFTLKHMVSKGWDVMFAKKVLEAAGASPLSFAFPKP